MNGISVVIPYYKDTKLNECIQKLVLEFMKLKKNDKKHVEIIIVNDGSTKPKLIKTKTKIKIVNLKKNLGVGKARNVGLKIAKKKYILFLDSDVLLADGYFQKVQNFIKNKKKKIFYFPQKYKPADKNPTLFQRYLACSWFVNQTLEYKSGEMITSFCLLVDRKYFIKIGGFGEKYKRAGGEEFQLISKINKNYIKICNLYCLHFQDKFLTRIKKLFLRSLNYKKVIIENKSISNSTKYNHSFKLILSLMIFLSIFLCAYLKELQYLLIIQIVIFLIIEKKFFNFLLKKNYFSLIIPSFCFKLIENVLIIFGILVSYLKKNV